MNKMLIVFSCFLVLLLGYASYRGYEVWRQKHDMVMARSFLAKADLRNAVLSLKQVLQANPRNVEASRLMAGLTEATRSRAALGWRQRVLELDPKSLEDRLALVQAAILFRDYPLATNTLAGVAEADKNTAVFHNIAGTVALQGGRADEAEDHFKESIRLNSADPIPRVNLAVVRLHRTNALDMAEARIALQRVILESTNIDLCNEARRELTIDAIRSNDTTTALARSEELVRQNNANFTDKLLRLDVLRKTKSADFKPALARYESEAATNVAKLYDMANWQINQLSPADALGWLQSLPPHARTNQPAALLAAECQVSVHDWKGMQNSLQSQNWPELEFERHALLARSLREQNLEESSKAEWQLALKAAGGKKIALMALAREAAQWRWTGETEQILWTIVNTFPDEQAAAQSLRQVLMAGGRTRSLLQLISIQARRNPSDLALKNDLAMVAMLLDAQELRPHDLAREAYQANPKNPSIVSTYAFSLYLQGKPADALKVMQQLDEKILSIPGIGSYYGLILKANGQLSQAKTYLQLSSKAGLLLPEEKTLFAKAQAGL